MGTLPAFPAPDKLGQYIFSIDETGARAANKMNSHARGEPAAPVPVLPRSPPRALPYSRQE